MKRLKTLPILFFAVSQLSAQLAFPLTSGQPAVLYSLPKTELIVVVEIEKTIQKPGMFFQYSERYLATKSVIVQDKTAYKIKSIQVQTRTSPDSNRTYTYTAPAKAPNLQLSINSAGILCGLNAEVKTESNNLDFQNGVVAEMSTKTTLLPLGEEYMMAGSTAKLAEGAAKQIYRIRENRLSLLTGEIEKLPYDGKSMEVMLSGMNEMERELTELFIGNTITETKVERIELRSDAAITNQVLFRFSTIKGLTSSDDLSAKPVYYSLLPEKIKTIEDPKAKKIKVILNTILPATTELKISDGENTLFKNQFLLPQFGVIIPLSEELFSKTSSKVIIDCSTGRLLEIK